MWYSSDLLNFRLAGDFVEVVFVSNLRNLVEEPFTDDVVVLVVEEMYLIFLKLQVFL